MNRYVREWGPFPSKSNPNKDYTVKLRNDDRISCNCGAWVFNRYPRQPAETMEGTEWWYDRWCPHLDMIIIDEAPPEAIREIILARVGKVEERDGKIFVPCYPITNKVISTGSRIELIMQQQKEHPLATIAYDLLQHGFSFEEIQEKFSMMPQHWTRKKVIEIVENKGKYIFSEGS